ncbi:MAG: multidrug effflux MFS transporter [Pseudoxanthomonas sp.]
MALLLGGLAMFGPFSIDAFFPAFPQMAASLRTDAVAMQQTVSVYLLAYALMSVVHGPLSDARGRRWVILAGLVVFVAASAGCALSPNLPALLVFRVVQGLSAGAGMIVGRAAIRDLYDGDDAQRLMSQVSMIFGIAPAIAPIIGGWLLGVGQWPWIFWFLTAFSAVLLLAVAVWMPETHPPHARQPLTPRKLLRDYAGILRNRRFLRLALAGSLAFSGIFLYIASAPVFVIELLGLGERDFAWLFIPTIGGMTLGAFVSGRAAGRMRGETQCRIGYACCGAAALANLAYSALATKLVVPWAVLPLFVGGFGMALIFPILSLAVLDMYARHRGAASSLQAFLQLAISAVVAGVLSPLLSHHPAGLALGFVVFFLLGWGCWRWEMRVAKRKLPDCPREAAAYEPTEPM